MSGNEFKFKKQQTPFGPIQGNDPAKVYKDRTTELGQDYVSYAAREVASSMKIKERTATGLSVNAYSSHFEDRLTPEKRSEMIEDEGSELYRKAQNKKLFVGAEEEFAKEYGKFERDFTKKNDIKQLEDHFVNIKYLMRFRDRKFNEKVWKDYKAGGEKRFAALDRLLEEFVNQDFNYDLSNDTAVARNALYFIQLEKRTNAFISLIGQNPEYWAAVDDDSKAAVMEKLDQANYLWDFYKRKEAVVCDEIYSTRLDVELSFVDPGYTTDAGRCRQNLNLIDKLQKAELSYERLKHIKDDDRNDIAEEELIKRIREQENLGKTAVPIGRKVKSKPKDFEWLDIFGWPLKALSYFMRDRRSTNHGSRRYDEMTAEFNKKFPEELHSIGIKNLHKFIPKREADSPAPQIELDPLFKDDLKFDLEKLLEDYVGADSEMDRSEEAQASLHLYENFLKALHMYTKIGGIVNADTTEMEMAFLDKMREYEAEFDKTHKPQLLAGNMEVRYEAVKTVMTLIRDRLNGNLKNVADRDEFESAVRNSVAVVLDTDIEDNMEGSNIKNIPVFTHTPNINDIKQSTIGDCYLVGAMTTFVRTSPQGVLNMFQDLGDGNVMVRLFEGYDERGERLDTDERWGDARRSGNIHMKPMYIKLRKHYETGDGNANDCVWPQLIEKAFAAAGFNMKGRSYVDERGHLHNLVTELTNGQGYIALSHMTGTGMDMISPAGLLSDHDNDIARRGFSDFFTSEQFKRRIGAGLPYFLTRELFAGVAAEEVRGATLKTLTDRFFPTLMGFMKTYGSSYVKVYRLFNEKGKGDDGKRLIKKISDSIGMPLRDGWENIEIGEDFTNWALLFKEDIPERFMRKFMENFENIRNRRDVTFDNVNGIDTAFFDKSEVTVLLDSIEKRMTGDVTNPDEEITNIEGLIDSSSISFAGSQNLKADTIRSHVSDHAGYWNNRVRRDNASHYAWSMCLSGHETLRDDMIDFAARLRTVLDKGGAMELSIPHFVSAIGLEYLNGQWYVLVKDPFNVYNMSYGTGPDGVQKLHEDGIFDVVSIEGLKIKRHLDDKGDAAKCFYGGFRGLSYWKIEDLYNKIVSYVPMVPEDVKTK